MEGSNSKDKEIQIPGRIMQLLKPVRTNPYLVNPKINCFLINVHRSVRVRTSRRYFFNMSSHPKYLSSILPTVVELARRCNWHALFLWTPCRDFHYWQDRYPMSVIRAKKCGGLCYPKKVGKPQLRRKIKRLRRTQLLRPPQLAPNESLEHPDPSDPPIFQSPNQTDNEIETEYSETDFSEDERSADEGV